MMKRVAEKGGQDLLQLLYQKGELSSSTLRTLKAYMKRWKADPLAALIDTHVLSESAVADVLARHLRLRRVLQCADLSIDRSTLDLVPFEQSRRFTCLPIDWSPKEHYVTVVTADPTSKDLDTVLKTHLCCPKGEKLQFGLAVGERTDILGAIEHHYPIDLQMQSSKWESAH